MANTYVTLDVSTGNLSLEDWDAVEDAAACDGTAATRASWMPRCVAHDYGAFVNVPDRDDYGSAEWEDRELELAANHPSLHALLEHARAHGCRWINVDRDADADADPDLDSYDW